MSVMQESEMPIFSAWSPWVAALIRTVVTVASAYVAGHLFNAIVIRRLARVAAAKTRREWDDTVVTELKRRIPFWALLIGGQVSLQYWGIGGLAARVLPALGVASVTMATAAVTTRLIAIYGPRAVPGVPVSGLTHTLVRIVITLLGVLVIIRSFDYDITPMLAALGVGGLAVALALQEPLSNLFAGIFTALAGQVRIGDYVRIDPGIEGHVVDFNWRSTRLRQLAGNIVVVPNAKLAQAVVTNFSLPAPDVGISLDFTVDASSDLAAVERVVLEVAREVQRHAHGAVTTTEPSLRYQGFTDTGVRCSLGLRVRDFADQFAVRHELVKRLQARFAREGIVLAIPSLRAAAAARPAGESLAEVPPPA
jgi:small-conductance mechanosensitive channel